MQLNKERVLNELMQEFCKFTNYRAKRARSDNVLFCIYRVPHVSKSALKTDFRLTADLGVTVIAYCMVSVLRFGFKRLRVACKDVT